MATQQFRDPALFPQDYYEGVVRQLIAIAEGLEAVSEFPAAEVVLALAEQLTVAHLPDTHALRRLMALAG